MLGDGRPSLIEGGIGHRASGPRARRRKSAVRAVAPLLVPLALALTLGIALAATSRTPHPVHVIQTTSTAGRP
jgi:hypothetical protein